MLYHFSIAQFPEDASSTRLLKMFGQTQPMKGKRGTGRQMRSKRLGRSRKGSSKQREKDGRQWWAENEINDGGRAW